MRILLSEGSGLTSRQVAGRFGSLGHDVEILSSSRICLTRFTRHVRAVHDVPRFGLDPFGRLAAAERIAGERKTDLLFPTQEQVAVLSARRKYLRVATIVPPFASLARVQDKSSAFRTLKAIGAPHRRLRDFERGRTTGRRNLSSLCPNDREHCEFGRPAGDERTRAWGRSARVRSRAIRTDRAESGIRAPRYGASGRREGPPCRTSCLSTVAGRRRGRGFAEGERCLTGARWHACAAGWGA
jgi:hypothetical protein